MSVLSRHILWASGKKPGKEHVKLPNFVRRFGYTNKDSANHDFLQLISSPHLRKRRRILLHNLYMHFKDNLEEAFWLNHTLKASTRNTAKQTAIAVQNVGALLARREYQSFTNHLSGDSPVSSEYIACVYVPDCNIRLPYVLICFCPHCTSWSKTPTR